MTNLMKALLSVQSEIGALSKDSKNPYFKSSYVSLNGVRDAVIPVLTKYGVVLMQPTVYQDGKTFVSTRLIHSESGETVEGLTEVVTAKAGDAQNFGSGLSYSRRYGLMSILCLAAEDDDGNLAVGKAKVATTEAVNVAKTVEVAAAPAEVAKAPAKKLSFNRNAAKPAAPAAAAPVAGDEL